MKHTKYTLISVFAVIFLTLAMFTELPKVPLAVLAVGIAVLALMKTWRQYAIANIAVIGLLITGAVCSSIFVANTDSEEVRTFMATRIERCGNADIVISLLGYVHDYKVPEVLTWRSVPWAALLPAFVLSELKTAFPVLAVGLTGLALVMMRRKKETGVRS